MGNVQNLIIAVNKKLFIYRIGMAKSAFMKTKVIVTRTIDLSLSLSQEEACENAGVECGFVCP